VKAFANSDVMYFSTSAQDGDPLQDDSTNPNTTINIVVERNTNPSFPTKVFKRIIFVGALKLGYRACRRELLRLDGDFMKGPFPGQVLAAVGLDSNNGIYSLAYALVEAESRALSDLMFDNICEVFNGKIVGGRDKSIITLLEYIKEYCMKRIVNVQSVIDKCTGPLTPTTTRIMEAIKKETHLLKVQWNGGVLEKFTCPTTLLPPNHVHIGKPKKKRKRSKLEDEPFVKHGKLSKKGKTINCQSCGNIGHNKATCKGQGGNNAEASASASGQAQQAKPVVGQVLVLEVKAHPLIDGQSEEYKHKDLVYKKELPLNLQVDLQLILKCK
ncbi:hypothetical protein Tco_0497288, partial [Tanacetum coccineum]